MEHPAGESDDGALRVDFDRRLQLEFHGARITSDGGLLAYRELDDALGLTAMAASVLAEDRRRRNIRHRLLRLMTKRVRMALRAQRDAGLVVSRQGPGQYMLRGPA